MAEQDFCNLLSQAGGYPGAAGAAFASFTALQDISPLPLPVSYGYQLRQGSKIELEAEGEFSTTGTPTLSLAFLYGATAGAAGTPAILAQSGVITTATGAAAFPWHLKARGVVTAVGTTGTIVMQGILDLGTSLTALAASAAPVTQALRTVTIDTTVNKLWGVGAAWGTSSASNSIKVNNFSALLMN
jgi:hypothetical protein